jgi:hypothetical protein
LIEDSKYGKLKSTKTPNLSIMRVDLEGEGVMQQDMQNRRQQELQNTSIEGAIAGVVDAVNADADLVRELARPDASYTISAGQVVQTPSAEIPASHLEGQDIAPGRTNTAPTTHEPATAQDETVGFKVRTAEMTLEFQTGNEPLILGGQGANAPAVTRGASFTIATTAPGTAFGRAA